MSLVARSVGLFSTLDHVVGASDGDILSAGVVSAFTSVAIDNVSWYLVLFTRASAAASTPSLQRMYCFVLRQPIFC